MSGNYTAQTLNNGVVTNSINPLYTVPSATVGFLSYVSISNNPLSSQPVLITTYKNLSGNLSYWQQFVLQPGGFADLLGGETLNLTAGDSIQAVQNTSNSSIITFSVHGVTEQ